MENKGPFSATTKQNEFGMRAKENTILKVSLLGENQPIRSILLPRFKEGRYSFDTTVNGKDLPLYIFATGNEWSARVEKGGFFSIEGAMPSNQAVLQEQTFLKVVYKKATYILYSESVFEGDNIFIPYYIEQGAEIKIGRLPSCDIFYPNTRISRIHAILRWRNNAWTITDANSKNGTFVNGTLVKSKTLNIGDVVYLMGLSILVGAGYICMNNANNRVRITSPKVREIKTENDMIFVPCPSTANPGLFERQPRRKYRIKPDPIEIESPPMEMTKNKIPLLLRMGNPLVMGGRAIATGNAFSAITSLVLPAITQGFTEKDLKEYESQRQKKYREYLEIKGQEIEKEVRDEQHLLNEIYPSLSEALQFPIQKNRLWEVRKTDDDFLRVRLGYGRIPMLAEKVFQKRRFEMEPDPLAEEMYQLAEKEYFLEHAPIMMSLRDDFVSSISGRRSNVLRLIENMCMSLSLTHAYDEVKLMLFAQPEEMAGFGFMRYLPHCWNNQKTIRFIAASKTDAQQLVKHLNNVWDEIAEEEKHSHSSSASVKTRPSYVIFVLSKELFENAEVFKSIISSEKYKGFSVVTAFDIALKESSKQIVMERNNTVVDFVHPEVEDQDFLLDMFDEKMAKRGLKGVMETQLAIEAEQHTLPKMLSFLEMYNVGMVEHLNPLKRWVDNDPVKSLSVPIGVGTDGALFALDLHEKRQGPHGLVAGMTGSGKSEFIITYILSMAVNFSPDEVAFILIDYKGGGLADAFVNESKGIFLPHVVGTITNLDGASIQRSLMSIRSELKRRQAVFKAAKSQINEGTMDIYDYQKLYRNKRVSEPMPHLFIISDEFAELKKQQPEFMDELISTARIGRSLGVHLILATQKPGGVVNDQIWSNTRFRACLRVQDRGDSMEMLKRPEAAELKDTGRFYLQVGYNEFFALGQSAWCGAGYTPQNEAQKKQEISIRIVDTVGQTVLVSKPEETNKNGPVGKQIVAIVQYLSDLSKREGIIGRPLWKKPLSSRIELAEIEQSFDVQDSSKIQAAIGMIDDPENQAQFSFWLDLQSFHNMLLVGNSGSGKTTFLSTMLFSLLNRYSQNEINYYILDLSGGGLFAYKDMPHCGAYLTENNEADFDRLLHLIRDMVEERKKLFAKANVMSYEAYRMVADLPLVLVIIDGFTNIMKFTRGSEYYGFIHDYMRDASGYGVRFILSCNHMNEVSAKSKQELDYRIALKAKDRFEYSDILNGKCFMAPPDIPGRGVCLIDGRTLEYQVAIANCNLDEQQRGQALMQALIGLKNKYGIKSEVKQLPMADAEQEYSDFCNGFERQRIPLGYSRKDMTKVALPFQQLHSMSLYFGNPQGVKPVFKNLLYAAVINEMDIILIRRQYDSVFESTKLQKSFSSIDTSKLTIFEMTTENIANLDQIMLEEIAARNVFRDRYCEENGIPKTDKSRAKKAAKFIRANTKPLMVLIECFDDFCRLDLSEDLVSEFTVFFERTKGYNIYFVAGFYPEDNEDITVKPLMKSFNKEQLLMLFGGCYDKQRLTNLPYDLKQMDKPNPKYDRYMLKYRMELYPMLMPCGKLNANKVDPDEAAII